MTFRPTGQCSSLDIVGIEGQPTEPLKSFWFRGGPYRPSGCLPNESSGIDRTAGNSPSRSAE